MNATLRTLALLIASIVVVTLGGELILLVIEEAADLALEATHALFLVLFERGFEMPHAQAEGLAAWLSAGLLLVLGLVAVWKAIPWVKRRLTLLRNRITDERTRACDLWRTARWYQKGLVVLSGVGLLFLASLFI